MRFLPEAYAQALTLRDQGCDQAEIAVAIGIVPQAISPLLHLAEVKLQQLLDIPPEVHDHLVSLAASLERLAESDGLDESTETVEPVDPTGD